MLSGTCISARPKRIDLKRKALAIPDRTSPEFAACFSDVFSATPLELLNEYPSPKELGNSDF